MEPSGEGYLTGEFIPLLKQRLNCQPGPSYLGECLYQAAKLDRQRKEAVPVSVNVSRVDIYTMMLWNAFAIW